MQARRRRGGVTCDADLGSRIHDPGASRAWPRREPVSLSRLRVAGLRGGLACHNVALALRCRGGDVVTA